MRPLDRLRERVDELDAQAALYPPRPADSDVEAVYAAESAPAPDSQDDREAAEAAWPHHG